MKTNTKKERTSKLWCECGRKMRGDNHYNGEHHKAYEKRLRGIKT